MTRTVLGELLQRLPIAYGNEINQLHASKVVELIERELEDLILKEKAQIMRAFEHGHRFGEFCTSEAYYTLKYERR